MLHGSGIKTAKLCQLNIIYDEHYSQEIRRIEYVLINCINQAKLHCDNSDNWLDHWKHLTIADKYKQVKIELLNHNFELEHPDRCLLALIMGMFNVDHYKAPVDKQIAHLIYVIEENK